MSEATKRASDALATALMPKSAKEILRGLLEDADRSQDRIRVLELIIVDMVGGGVNGIKYERVCQCLDQNLMGSIKK